MSPLDWIKQFLERSIAPSLEGIKQRLEIIDANQRRLEEKLEERFARLDLKIDQNVGRLEEKIGRLNEKIDQNIARLDDRIEQLGDKIETSVGRLDDKLEAQIQYMKEVILLHERLAAVEARVNRP